MSPMPFRRRAGTPPRTAPAPAALGPLVQAASIEVMPRTAARIDSFAAILPPGTRVYIAHIDGTDMDDMVATARRIAGEGFPVMPHFPARSIPDAATLADWIARYQGEAGIDQALVLAGGRATPAGTFDSSMQLLETGAFDAAGFTDIHVAGHPEGNRDIDPDGGEAQVMAALRWKQHFAARSDARMAIVTQFAFEARPVLDWIARLEAAGIDLPVHLGIAGPAKLQTLIRFAISCGVGASLDVLKRRARDVTRLVQPFEPTALVDDLATALETLPATTLSRLHLFPLGGIAASADWLGAQRDRCAAAAP